MAVEPYLVKDINPVIAGPGDGNPTELVALGSLVFFQGCDGRGCELWKSDGTWAGTVLVEDIYPGAGSSWPGELTAVSGTLFFRASDGTNGYELWKSDGTAAGMVLVKDINSVSGSSSSGGLTAVDGTLFFSANDGTKAAMVGLAEARDRDGRSVMLEMMPTR